MVFDGLFDRMYGFARRKGIMNDSSASPFAKYFRVWNSRMILFASVPVAIAISMIIYGRHVLVRETTNALHQNHHKESLDQLFQSLKSEGVFAKVLDIDVDCSDRDRMARIKQAMTDIQKMKRFLAIERKYIDPDMVESKIDRLQGLSDDEKRQRRDSKAYRDDPTAMNKF